MLGAREGELAMRVELFEERDEEKSRLVAGEFEDEGEGALIPMHLIAGRGAREEGVVCGALQVGPAANQRGRSS
jgi:hypothetical protein